MNKLFKLICGLLIAISCVGCESSKNEPTDFWSETIDVIESNVNYDKSKWEIGVQSKDYAENPNHRNLTVRYKNDSKSNCLFAFQNNSNEYIYYKYEITTSPLSVYDEDLYHKVEIKSIDEHFKEYEVKYTVDIYRENRYFDSQSSEGKIIINSDGSIHFDNMPYLRKAIDSLYFFMNEFETLFKIDYNKYNFIYLPKLMHNLEFANIINISDMDSNTLNYYSKERINAKGYRLVTFTKIAKDFSTIQFGEYCYDQAAYSFNYYVDLYKRNIENCYNIMIAGDVESSYAIYIKEDKVYLYYQSEDDKYIYNDVNNNLGENAEMILYKGDKKF